MKVCIGTNSTPEVPPPLGILHRFSPAASMGNACGKDDSYDAGQGPHPARDSAAGRGCSVKRGGLFRCMLHAPRISLFLCFMCRLMWANCGCSDLCVTQLLCRAWSPLWGKDLVKLWLSRPCASDSQRALPSVGSWWILARLQAARSDLSLRRYDAVLGSLSRRRVLGRGQ